MGYTGRVISNRLIQPKKPKTIQPWQPSWGKPLGSSPFQATTPNASAVTPPSATPAQSAADPRDSGYFNDVAKLNQFTSSQRAQLTATQQQLARNLATGQKNLQEQQPKDELSAKQNANKAGLFYSGALGKNLGDIAQNYAQRRSDLQTDYEGKSGDITRQLSALDQQYPLQLNDALLSGVGRATASDQANAMGLAANQSTAAAAKLPYKTQAGNGGVWHIYPGGRKVFVRK